MSLKECVKEYQNYKNIIVKSVETTNFATIKKNNKWLIDVNSILNKIVLDVTTIDQEEKVIIRYYLYDYKEVK